MKCIRKALLPPRFLPPSSGSTRTKLKDRIRNSFSSSHEEDTSARSSFSTMPDECGVARSLSDIISDHEWVRLHLDEPLPSPRSKHGATGIGERMFVVGGRSAEGILGDIQVLDTRELLWRELSSDAGGSPKVPSPRFVGHFVGQWKNRLVVVGGELEAKTSFVKVHAFDFESKSWSVLTSSGEIPPARIGQSVVQVDSRLIMFGGEDASGRMLDELYVLDLETFFWDAPKTAGLKPAPRKFHAAGCYGERYMWIFGGKSYATYYKDVFCLDLNTMEWTREKTGGSLPQVGRARHVGVMVERRLYFVGGENRGQEMVDTLMLDVVKREWSTVTTIEPMSPLAHDGLSVVKLQSEGRDYLVAFGGHGTLLSSQVYAMLVTSSSSSRKVHSRLSRSSSASSIGSAKELLTPTLKSRGSGSPTGHFNLNESYTSSSSTDLSSSSTATGGIFERSIPSIGENDVSRLTSLSRDRTLSMEDIMTMMREVVRSESNLSSRVSPLTRSMSCDNTSSAKMLPDNEDFITIENVSRQEKAAFTPGTSGRSERDFPTSSLARGDPHEHSLRFPSSRQTTEAESTLAMRSDSRYKFNPDDSSMRISSSPSQSKKWADPSRHQERAQNSPDHATINDQYLATALATVRELYSQVVLLHKNKKQQEKNQQTRFRTMEAMASKLEVTVQQQLITERKLQETIQLQKDTEKKLQEISQLQKSTERRYQSMKQQKSDIEKEYRASLQQKGEIETHLKMLAISDS